MPFAVSDVPSNIVPENCSCLPASASAIAFHTSSGIWPSRARSVIASPASGCCAAACANICNGNAGLVAPSPGVSANAARLGIPAPSGKPASAISEYSRHCGSHASRTATASSPPYPRSRSNSGATSGPCCGGACTAPWSVLATASITSSPCDPGSSFSTARASITTSIGCVVWCSTSSDTATASLPPISSNVSMTASRSVRRPTRAPPVIFAKSTSSPARRKSRIAGTLAAPRCRTSCSMRSMYWAPPGVIARILLTCDAKTSTCERRCRDSSGGSRPFGARRKGASASESVDASRRPDTRADDAVGRAPTSTSARARVRCAVASRVPSAA